MPRIWATRFGGRSRPMTVDALDVIPSLAISAANAPRAPVAKPKKNANNEGTLYQRKDGRW